MLHFFDVGANIGQTFDDFLTRDPQYDGAAVWCFQPSPRHLPALMEKAASLRDRYQIHVCPFGLRGRTDIRPFFEKDDPRGDSFESYLASDHVTQNLSPGYALHVPTYDIGDFISKHTHPEDRIILKLDCEGSEYELLFNLMYHPSIKRIAHIYVEWHTIRPSPIADSTRLEELLRANGIPVSRWQF